MKLSTSLLYAIASVVTAAPLPQVTPQSQVTTQTQAQSPGYLQLPLSHQVIESTPGPTNLGTQGATIGPSPLQNHISYYSAEIAVGSGTGQTFELSVDTGSSDLWVRDSSTGKTPSFNPALSDTLKTLNEPFSIGYLQGSAAGTWVTDEVQIAGVTLQSQQFGLATSPQAGGGTLGMGFQGLETATTKYSNLPMSLKEQGFTKSNAYSLFLDDINANSGSLLLGGVQPTKYTGPLVTIPIEQGNTITINFDSLIVHKDTAIALPEGGINTLLDSGTSLTYLPDPIVQVIADRFNAVWYPDLNAYYTNDFDDDSVLTYEFSGFQVTVPASEVLIPGSVYGGSNAPAKYMLTVVPYSKSQQYTILGDSFLRGVYAVFDLDNREVSLAQSSFSSDEGTIEVIDATVPGAIRAPNYRK